MDPETETTESQYVVQKNGISRERVVNVEQIAIIEDLIKCSICLDILSKPLHNFLNIITLLFIKLRCPFPSS